jgi:hypothetical protein
MKTNVLTHVRKLYNTEGVDKRINRHNQRQWVKSIRYLGDKWLLAVPVQRKDDVHGE